MVISGDSCRLTALKKPTAITSSEAASEQPDWKLVFHICLPVAASTL